MILFLVAGFGYGNASRQLAIIEELRKKNSTLPITVFSWGRGFDFLSPESKVHQFDLRSLFSFTPRLKNSFLGSFLLTSLFYLAQYPVNFLYLLIWGLRHRPKLVVFDSDYHIPAFLLIGAERISVNQVPNIYWLGKKYSLSFIYGNGYLFSYLIESVDYWFQCLFANEILVPVLSRHKNFRAKPWVRTTPLIVRQEFLASHAKPRIGTQAPALILGGSGVDTAELRDWAHKNSIRIFERLPGESSKESALLKSLGAYSPIIIQGGLSSISESLALKNHLFISPVKNHWEQFINSEEVISLGLGQCIKLGELKEPLAEPVSAPVTVDCLGAGFIAEYLYEKIQKF